MFAVASTPHHFADAPLVRKPVVLIESADTTFAYLPVPEVVARLGLYVTGAGTDFVPAGSKYPRQKHPELYDFSWRTGRVLPEFQFVLISEGQGEFESQTSGRLAVKAGTMIMLFPDVWHRYRPDRETGWKEYWISLGGDLLFQWHKRGLFRSDRPLSTIRKPVVVERQYRKVIDFVMKQPMQDAPMLAAHAMAVIASALEQVQTSTSGLHESERSLDPIVSRALALIWNHSHQKISVDTIAKQTGVTRRTLERRFRQHFGRTIMQELVACRIQRAKRMLGETHVPIKYVAFAAGFSSQSNFCKSFRRETGMTPGEFRMHEVEQSVNNQTHSK